MPERPNDPPETIKALEELQAAASRPPPQVQPPREDAYGIAPATKRGHTPAPRVAPEHPKMEPLKAERAATRADTSTTGAVGSDGGADDGNERGAAPEFRCLACGYSLLADSGYRCSECGRQYEHETLESVFHGGEREQLTRIIWLVHAALILKLYMLPQIVGLDLGSYSGILFFANALVVIWTCYMAGRDRRDSIGGYYATAALAAGVVNLLGVFRGACIRMGDPILYGLDAIAGCLLLLAILTRPDGAELWRGRGTRKVALTAAIAIPPVVAAAYGIEVMLIQAGGGATQAALRFVNSTTLGAILSIGSWLWVRGWLVGYRRNVLVGAEDA